MYIYSPLTTRNYPNVRELRNAFASADRYGDQRDARPVAAISERALQSNLRLRGHRLVRKTALTSFSWQITDPSAAASDQADVAKKALRVAMQAILNHHTASAFFGDSAIRMSWALDGTTWTVVRAEPVHQTQIQRESNGDVSVLDPDSAVLKRIARLNVWEQNDDYIVTTDSEPVAGGLLRSIVPTEVIRYDVVRENANFLKKLKGILQIINRGAADGDDQLAAEEAAQTAAENNYVVTSDLIEFKLNQIAGAGGGFKEMVQSLNDDIAVACLGQANTTQLPSGGGSRAALQVLKMITADIRYEDQVRAEETANRLLALWWLKVHGTSECPLQFRMLIEEEQDHESNVIVVREALNAGIPILRSELYPKIGFTVPRTGEDVITSAAGV